MDERFGGVLLVATSDASFPYVRLSGNQMWYPCEKSADINIQNIPGFQKNYTSGHDGDANHEWTLKSIEVFQPRDGSEYDAIYLMFYTPSHPDFMESWLEKQSEH